MTDDNANEQVDAFLSTLYIRFGVHESDLKRWISVLPAIIDSHERSARYGELVAKALISAVAVCLVGAMFGAVGWAVMHFIRDMI